MVLLSLVQFLHPLQESENTTITTIKSSAKEVNDPNKTCMCMPMKSHFAKVRLSK
jgi:hypothetical protein